MEFIMSTRTIDCEVFIVPNSIMCIDDKFATHPFHTQKALGIDHLYGTDFSEPCVQVWMTNKGMETEEIKGSENWQDHSTPYGVFSNEIYFPNRLPVSLFEGKKEGDTIILTCNDVKENSDEEIVPSTGTVILRIKLAQQKYRYRNFGTFEKCLGDLLCIYRARVK